MQTAGGLVGAGVEFTAGVQGGENNFEGGLARVFRVIVDRDAAAVVGNDDAAVFDQGDFDFRCVAGDGFVHRVIENFGDEVVQGAFIGAADIHAGAFTNRFETFQHFDGFGGVVIAAR